PLPRCRRPLRDAFADTGLPVVPASRAATTSPTAAASYQAADDAAFRKPPAAAPHRQTPAARRPEHGQQGRMTAHRPTAASRGPGWVGTGPVESEATDAVLARPGVG